MRAFVKLRRVIGSHVELARNLRRWKNASKGMASVRSRILTPISDTVFMETVRGDPPRGGTRPTESASHPV